MLSCTFARLLLFAILSAQSLNVEARPGRGGYNGIDITESEPPVQGRSAQPGRGGYNGITVPAAVVADTVTAASPAETPAGTV